MRINPALATCTALMAALVTLVTLESRAVARGGEDWPHFCTFDRESAGGLDAFKIHPDADSPTGYGLELFSNGDSVEYIVADVRDTDAHNNPLPYYQVYASEEYGLFHLRDRQILLEIQKDNAKQSQGDVQITLRNATMYYNPLPMNCGTGS